MALRQRRPIAPKPPDPRLREEIWGYRRGQTVELLKAPEGMPGEMKGSKWKLVSVRVDDAGEPVEFTVYGGAPNHGATRTFPISRLKPPKPPRIPRKK